MSYEKSVETCLSHVRETASVYTKDVKSPAVSKGSNYGIGSAISEGDFSPAAAIQDGSAATLGIYAPALTTGMRVVSVSLDQYSPAVACGKAALAISSAILSDAITTGKDAVASTSRAGSHAICTGKNSKALVKDKNSIAVSLGPGGMVRGPIGAHLVLAEWDHNTLLSVQSTVVDGVSILPNTFYRLEEGIFVACEDGE